MNNESRIPKNDQQGPCQVKMKKIILIILCTGITIFISNCSNSSQKELLLGKWVLDSVEVFDSWVPKWKRYDGLGFLKIELLDKKMNISRGYIFKDTTIEWFGPFPLKKSGKNKWKYKDMAFVGTLHIEKNRLICETSEHIISGASPSKGMFTKQNY